MADLQPVAGAKIYIGGTHATQNADFVESDLSGDSFTLIDGWSQMGGYGDSVNEIKETLINRGRDIVTKGTFSGAKMDNVFTFVQSDAGQAALKAAFASRSNYAFKIVYDDSLGTNGTTHYFIGLVMSYSQQGGNANTNRKIAASVTINSNLVEVTAS